MSLRSRLEEARFNARVALKLGRYPNALIIGAAKAGTTSLFSFLAKHPEVCTPVHKELRFFDNRWHLGESWYRASFKPDARQKVCLEASPMYLPHPLVPERAHMLVPDARLIVILREPIARAYSEHAMRARQGFEELSFTEALLREPERLEGFEEALARGEVHRSFNRFAYVYRSIYAPQIERWLSVYPRERILFVKAENLFADPASVTEQVLQFLQLRRTNAAHFQALNQHDYPAMPETTLVSLQKVFAEPNEQLAKLTGIAWT